MAILRSSFRNIPSSGEIPETMVPATAWAVSYELIYEMNVSDADLSPTLTNTLLLHVLNAAGTLKYVITIEEHYFFLLMRAGPGLVFYTWNWIPSEEKITARKGLEPDAPVMATLGAGSFGVEPAQDTGNSDGSVIIQSRYYSGIFKEPLETGDRLHIARHTVDTGSVIAPARLQLATELGGPTSCALRVGTVGTVWHVAPKENGLNIANTRRDQTFDGNATHFITNRRARFVRAFHHGATLHFMVGYPFEADSGLSVLTSIDHGTSWQGDNVLMRDFLVLAARLSEDGGTFWLYGVTAQKPARAVLRREGSGWKVSERGAIKYLDEHPEDLTKPIPPPLPQAGVATLEVSGDTLHLVAGGTNGGGPDDPVRIWLSTDELASVREMKIVEEEKKK